jgi:hypothetical protein
MEDIIKDMKITLYDLFGYLMPGIVFLLAIVILFWTLYYRDKVVDLAAVLGTIRDNWLLALLGAYFSGHIAQGLGNLLNHPPIETRVFEDKDRCISKDIAHVVIKKASESLKLELPDMSSDDLYRFCDEAVVQNGKSENRELFLYREGFYRGLTVSFVLLLIATLVRLVVPGARARIVDSTEPLIIGWNMGMFFVVLFLAASVFFFLRYKRFANYRARAAIFGFLSVSGKNE